MRISKTAMATAAGLCGILSAMAARADVDEAVAVRGVIAAYQDALDAGDVEASIGLYAEDGVALTPGRPTIVGRPALRQAYAAGAEAIAFDVVFAIQEIEIVSPVWAFVRTGSKGTSRLKATGVARAEANQELFVLGKDAAGRWRIKEYGFSPTSPVS